MRVPVALIFLLLATSCEVRHNPRTRDPTQATSRCEEAASVQLSRFKPEKFDREVFRRLPSDPQSKAEVFWRDTFYQGRPVSSRKIRCIEREGVVESTELETKLYPQ